MESNNLLEKIRSELQAETSEKGPEHLYQDLRGLLGIGTEPGKDDVSTVWLVRRSLGSEWERLKQTMIEMEHNKEISNEKLRVIAKEIQFLCKKNGMTDLLIC